MKHLILFFLGFAGAHGAVLAQGIHFEKDSLTQVFAKARQQNKPVLVLLLPPPPPANLPPALKKSRGESGINRPAVTAALNKDFLNKELVFGTAEAAAVVRKYTVVGYPTYLYFGPDGTLLYRSYGNASTEERYLRDLQAFRQAQADPENLSHLQEEYRQGNWSAEFLKRYISKRRQMGLQADPKVLDAYVQLLPVQAFDQAAEVVFVLENGPIAGSKAQKLTRLNTRLYDSLYQALPLPQRVAINKSIITNTIAQAIATKDRSLAMQGAEFARGTWNKDYVRGSRAYETHMLHFYSSTKDTTDYLRSAFSYYERYYMTVSADSARKVVAALQAFRQAQRAHREKLAQAVGKPAGANLVTTSTSAVQPVGIASGPPGSFLMDLNNGAWAIYQTGTRNSQYLLRAVQWSKRTVDLAPTPYNYDTLAHLLYRLRFFSEAEAMQQQALAAARQEKAPTTGYERELEKIKKRTL